MLYDGSYLLEYKLGSAILRSFSLLKHCKKPYSLLWPLYTMTTHNYRDKTQEEYQPQDLNKPELSTPEGAALQILKDLKAPVIALQQAKFNPKVALVDPKSEDSLVEKTLWRVICCVWNGTKLELCTTNDRAANKCRDTFGWEVHPEIEAAYKYSKSFEDTTETRVLFEWIKLPGEDIPSDEDKTQDRKRDKGESQEENKKPEMIAATWTSNQTDGSKESRENQKGIRWWRKHTIQRWRKSIHP